MAMRDDILQAIKQRNTKQLIQLLNSITSLNLNNCKIGDMGAQEIAAALKANKTLNLLNLGDNQISEKGIKEIASALKINNIISSLSLSGNPIGENGVKEIAAMLEINKTINFLTLHRNQITENSAKEIAEALKINNTLNSLGLNANHIGDNGAKEIAEALKTNNAINSLDISENKIGDMGITKIAEALETNHTITTLNLYKNDIYDNSATKIAETLKINKTITALNLGMNKINENGARKIAEILKINKTITSINLWKNQISEQLKKEINDLIARNGSLQNNFIQALKQNNFEQAQQLLRLGVQPNEVLHKLATDDNSQLKPIQYLFQITQNCNSPIFRGTMTEAIGNAQYRSHSDVVNFLQQMLQMPTDNPQPIGMKQKIVEEKIAEPKIEAKSFDQSYLIPYATLQIVRELGAGGFGKVYEGKWQYEPVAIKQLFLKQLSSDALEEFKSEALLMTRLHHPRVVTLFGVSIDKPGSYSLVMEYMPYGSLYNVLRNKNQLLAWDLRYHISMDICAGLSHLHKQNILHRDLKSMNVLLDDRLRAKLSDFGLSKLRNESTTTATKAGGSAVGTIPWMAPELFERKSKYTKASDIYSLGMVFWEIAARLLPFADAIDPMQIIAWKGKGDNENIPEDCPPKYAQLITWCWQEQTTRPTITQAGEILEQTIAKNTQPSVANPIYQSGPVYQQNSVNLAEENKSMPNYQLNTLSIKP